MIDVASAKSKAVEAVSILAGAAVRSGDHENGLRYAETAIGIDPDSWMAWTNKTVALTNLSRLDEASVAAVRTMELARGVHAEPYVACGVLSVARRDIPAAIRYYERAVDFPGAEADTVNYNLGCCLMILNRDMRRGWEHYELRWKLFDRVKQFMSHLSKIPMWDGGDLTGKRLLVFCEQGVGDVIQQLRFIPELRYRFNPAKMHLEVQDTLGRVCRQFSEIDEIVTRTVGTPYKPLPTVDCMVSISSLPLLMGYSGLEDIPKPEKYLSPLVGTESPVPDNVWAESEGKLRVAISYAGAAIHSADHSRSIHLSRFKELMGPNVELFLLARDTPERTWNGQKVNLLDGAEGVKLTDLSSYVKDFNDTLHVLNKIDLVVTIDSAMCHVSAAAGKKTWMLLPRVCDCRWLLDTEYSPWYPSLRLFRQSQSFVWDDVFARVSESMRKEFALDT